MTAEELDAMLELPMGAVYTPALGTVGAAMYTYTADQMRAFALAHRVHERDKWRRVLAESCDAFRSDMMGEAGSAGGCSRATEAESDLAILRAAFANVVEALAKAKPVMYDSAPAPEYAAFCGALDTARGLVRPNVRGNLDPTAREET